MVSINVEMVNARFVNNTNEMYCNSNTNIFVKKVLPIPIAILL